MRTRPRRLRLMAAAAALGTAWIMAPHAIPLYDGIGVPDEPYRFVSPPAGYQQTPPPSSVSVSVPASDGTNSGSGVLVQTAEQSSQSGLFVIPKSFVGPAATKAFTVSIKPMAPDGATPGGPVDGNVYRITVLADGSTPATLSPSGTNQPYSQRATSATIAAATMYYRPVNGSWRSVPAVKAGTDSFQAYFVGPGDYALAQAKAPSSSSSHTLVIVILALVVLAMVAAVVLIRASRRAKPS